MCFNQYFLNSTGSMLYSGFTEEDFELLTSLTSWCTCGSGKPRKSRELEGETEVREEEEHSPPPVLHTNDR